MGIEKTEDGMFKVKIEDSGYLCYEGDFVNEETAIFVFNIGSRNYKLPHENVNDILTKKQINSALLEITARMKLNDEMLRF